jgi:lysophospholipase L1-like esterase
MLEAIPPATLATIAPVNLRNCAPLIPHLRQQPADVVILQLGNYETLASIRKHLRAVLRLSRPSSSSKLEGDAGVPLEPDTIFPPTAPWRLRVLSKQLYGMSIGRMDPPLFDAKTFRHSAEQLLSNLAQLHESAPKLLIFLSPIPTADPLIRRYRSQAAEILNDLCSKAPDNLPFRVHYLDSAAALGIGHQNKQALTAGIFADDLHLNRRGHLLLGNALASVLQQNLRDEDSPAYNIYDKGSARPNSTASSQDALEQTR